MNVGPNVKGGVNKNLENERGKKVKEPRKTNEFLKKETSIGKEQGGVFGITRKTIGLEGLSEYSKHRAILNKTMDACIENGLIAFSWFPMSGEILQDVLGELGIKNVLVKEITCWKFLLRFRNKEDSMNFDQKKVDDWL